MSLPVFRLRDGTTLPCKPIGQMRKGWIPGTLINYIQLEDDNGKYLGCDWATKQPDVGGIGGFTINGSYELKNGFDFRFANNNESSGMWTPDEGIIFSKSEENYTLEFEKINHQLQKEGKDTTTINYEGGCFRIYTFEKYDNEYITSNGVKGGEIDWKSKVGTLLACSVRSLFTTEENNVLTELLEYRIGGFYKDEHGKEYIYAVRR